MLTTYDYRLPLQSQQEEGGKGSKGCQGEGQA